MNKRLIQILLFVFFIFSCKNASGTGDTTVDKLGKPVFNASKFQQVADLQEQLHSISKSETPSVVYIGTEKVVTQKYYDPFNFFFQDPFGFGGPNGNGNQQQQQQQPQERKFKQSGLGSGVIYKQKGNTYYIVTNNHVIEGADSIKVTIDQKDFYKGTVLGSDPAVDIAVVKIETNKELQVAQFGNSDELQVGDFVVAIGNPYGLSGTMTFGIISALGRSDIASDNPVLNSFIQTDTAINPGNSGGPLIDIKGQVIGINTLIYSQSGGNVGIGFAIPVNIAKSTADQIIEKGKVSHGYLGVYFQELTEESIKTLDLKGVTTGMLVNNVFANSPAEKAGIKTGDVIIEVNGKKLTKSSDLTQVVGNSQPGATLNLKIIREGKTISKDVVLGNRDEMKKAESKTNSQNIEKYGFQLASITPDLRSKYNIPNNLNGVIVTQIAQGGRAESVGMQEGDLIFKINNKQVTSVGDIEKLTTGNDTNYFFVYRGGREIIVLM